MKAALRTEAGAPGWVWVHWGEGRPEAWALQLFKRLIVNCSPEERGRLMTSSFFAYVPKRLAAHVSAQLRAL